jgi:uncharacterized membrane protein YeaQ/YmgE (transglycosylase-associated protein family)
MSLIGSAVIGMIAGWVAARWMRGNGFGLLGDVVAGVVGAMLGGHVLHVAGMNLEGGFAGRLVVAAIAAAIVLFLVHLLTGWRDGQRLWS